MCVRIIMPLLSEMHKRSIQFYEFISLQKFNLSFKMSLAYVGIEIK